jgi:hypothetical protein
MATRKPVKSRTTRSATRVTDPAPREPHPPGAFSERPLYGSGRNGTRDDLAEELGEAFVRSVTSGEDGGIEVSEEEVPEEEGGPFLETSGRVEFAHDVDASNPVDAEPQALPYVSPMRKRPGR